MSLTRRRRLGLAPATGTAAICATAGTGGGSRVGDRRGSQMASSRTRRRRSRTCSRAWSRVLWYPRTRRCRRMVERASAELFSAAGLDWMSDSTGAWYNLIGEDAGLAHCFAKQRKRIAPAIRECLEEGAGGLARWQTPEVGWICRCPRYGQGGLASGANLPETHSLLIL